MRLFLSAILAFGVLFASPAFAQISLELDGGKTMTIYATQTYQKDKYDNAHYVRLESDTLYCFTYQSKAKILDEIRIPLRFFDKANTKKYGAKMKVLSGKAYLNTMLSFKSCDKDQYMMEMFLNLYRVVRHGYKGNEKPSNYNFSLYFDTKEAADAFLQKVQERVKALN